MVVSFRESGVADAAAHALLSEYFSARARSFPAAQGRYVTTFPSPDHFEPPRGVFLVVEGEDLSGDAADVGCGGIRSLDSDAGTGATFEIKHLWLKPDVRGLGHGRMLLAQLERHALAFGARRLVLDTNASLAAAGGLYRSSGFVDVPAYNDNPNATNWYAKELDERR